MLFRVLMSNTLINIQKTRFWISRFLSSCRVLCVHFSVLIPNDVKYTQNTRFFLGIFFPCFSIHSSIHAFFFFCILISRNLKKHKMNVYRNVFSFPIYCTFLDFGVFYVTSSKTLKILVFGNIILFLHQGIFFAYVLVF